MRTLNLLFEIWKGVTEESIRLCDSHYMYFAKEWMLFWDILMDLDTSLRCVTVTLANIL